MSSSAYSLRANVLESLLKTKRPDVPLWVVLRNTAAVALPLAIGIASGHTAVGLGISAGALDIMFSDQPGPYRQRLTQLLAASLAAAFAALLGFLIGDQTLPMVCATLVFGFAGGLLVIFGADMARVGMTSMMMLVITAATPASYAAAINATGLIFSGGLLLTLCSVAAWPLQRYRPERDVLATVYRGLATMAHQQPHGDTDAPALSEAMTTLQHTLLGRHHAHGRAMEAFIVLLELAERIRLELVAMSELCVHSHAHKRFRYNAARVLTAIAKALEEGEAPQRAERLLHAMQSHRYGTSNQTHSNLLSAHCQALSGQLAAAVRNANWAGSRGELRASDAETQLPHALRSNSAWAMLRANLTPHSMAFRHAIRCAICLSIAQLGSSQLHHGYWLPMTVAIVLRPDFAATFNFGLLRVIGTVLGLLLTTALLHITPHDVWSHLLLMALLCMAFRYLATAHYGIAVAALTGTVVILLSFDGVNPTSAVHERVINTMLGSSMALLAYIVWPSWERTRVQPALADMLDAYAAYLKALSHPEQYGLHRETRTAVRTSRTNAQASLDRVRAEPGTPRPLLELAQALFANGNRLARTAMSWEALVKEYPHIPETAEVSAFIEQAHEALRAIATALRHQRIPQNLPELRALQSGLKALLEVTEDRTWAQQLEHLSDRLVDNIDTLAHIIVRSQQPAAQTLATAT